MFFLVKLTLFCSCDVCFCCVRFCFFSTMPRYWPGRTSPKWPISCWVGRKTLTQSINQLRQGRGMEGEGRKEQKEGMERKGRNLHPEQKKWKVGAGVPSYHVVAKRYSPVTAVKRLSKQVSKGLNGIRSSAPAGSYARYTLYPCSRAAFKGRKYGPVNTGVILDTREHGPSRSAGAVVNDVIIFYLQDGCPKHRHHEY